MRRRISAALLMSTMLAIGPAVAQSTDAQPGAAPASPPMGKFVADQGMGEFRTSKFVGLDIYGPGGEKVGDITDILIDRTGKATAAVIGVGGFLGIGQKNVAVPFGSIDWVNAKPSAGSASTASPSTTGSTSPAPSPGPAGTGGPAAPAAPTRTPDEQATYNGYPDHGVVKLTKAELQDAPAFKYYSDTHPSTGGSNAAPAGAPRQ